MGTPLCSSPGPHRGEAARLEEKATSEEGARSEDAEFGEKAGGGLKSWGPKYQLGLRELGKSGVRESDPTSGG